MRKWLGKHTCMELETRWKTICLSAGINFYSKLAWFNFLFWNFNLAWDIQPGKV